ncbi:MAG: hypothetical protein Q4G43_03980 [Mobilicoccus sp.]|nr:hypothetical protein [Mobilicoccus sp.]
MTAAPEPAGPTATPTSEPLPPNHTAGPDGTPEPLPTPTCALPPWAPQDEDAASITAQESDGVEAEETTEPTDVPTPTSTTAPAPTPDATR